jgi:hypothetical protein
MKESASVFLGGLNPRVDVPVGLIRSFAQAAARWQGRN